MKTLVNFLRIKKITVVLGVVFLTFGSMYAQKSVSDLSYLSKTELVNVMNESLQTVKEVLNILPVFDFDVVVEAPLEVENWMLNTESWESNYVDEAEMKVEDWMLDTQSWLTAEVEDGPSVEDWMLNFHKNVPTDEEITESELELEDWMCNPDAWNK
ncbi:MAG: hypothetical protein ACOC2F_05340 [Bacteroidota bacterium]